MQKKKLLQIAKDKEVGTIVVGSRGFSTAEEFLLGSVSLKISQGKVLISCCEMKM
jgi:nucleotide-binding universal stress UspA family protein